MNAMEKTIEYQKKRREVPASLKEQVKEFNRNKKAILNALKGGPKSVPQLTKETGMPDHQVMYILMTLRKYSDVVVDEIDDMDEYFFYKLTKED
jgi:predicted transcriptional regulator